MASHNTLITIRFHHLVYSTIAIDFLSKTFSFRHETWVVVLKLLLRSISAIGLYTINVAFELIYEKRRAVTNTNGGFRSRGTALPVPTETNESALNSVLNLQLTHKRKAIDHFKVVCSGTWPLNGSEALF